MTRLHLVYRMLFIDSRGFHHGQTRCVLFPGKVSAFTGVYICNGGAGGDAGGAGGDQS